MQRIRSNPSPIKRRGEAITVRLQLEDGSNVEITGT
jgi:hypothetical protein